MADWTWVPWTLTLIGWIVANRFSMRAQRKNFAMQARNAARLEIATAIRGYQDWLSGLTTFTLSLPYSLDDIERGQPWAKKPWDLWEEGRKRAHPDNSEGAYGWLLMLEEYEILFPKTRDLRFALFDYNQKLHEDLNELLFSLGPPGDPPKSRILAKSVFERAGEISAFMHDLAVYLQNETLHEVTRSRVPYRVPGDPTVSRILIRPDGTPYIMPATARETKGDSATRGKGMTVSAESPQGADQILPTAPHRVEGSAYGSHEAEPRTRSRSPQ